jgi:manganese/zinc/iron transport system permease protein
MSELLPTFDFHTVFVAPWTEDWRLYGVIALMGFLVSLACGLCGTFLVLRRLSLLGDAISHSVLPGLVLAFLWTGARHPLAMLVGAAGSGLFATAAIEFLQSRSRLKGDAATGIVFTTLFAFGVFLLTRHAHAVDLDPDCVLHGEIGFLPFQPSVEWLGLSLGPRPVVFMAAVALGVIALGALLYPALLVSSFDPGLAASRGLSPRFMHHLLLGGVAVVVVAAFEAVGAILVIGMLILPPAFGLLLTRRLPALLALTVLHGALSAPLGVSLAIWLNCAIAPAMVVAGALLFGLAWLASLARGLTRRGGQ